MLLVLARTDLLHQITSISTLTLFLFIFNLRPTYSYGIMYEDINYKNSEFDFYFRITVFFILNMYVVRMISIGINQNSHN